MKYLIKKYEMKRDTNMIKPIKIPIWIVFLVLPLIEFLLGELIHNLS